MQKPPPWKVGDRPLLALDLGTSTGWASRDGQGIVTAGRWKLPSPTVRNKQPQGRRWAAFVDHLGEAVSCLGPEILVAFEDVPPQVHRGGRAAHVYGALRGLLEWRSFIDRFELTSYKVSTVKRLAAGHGHAPKEAVAAAVAMDWPHLSFETDDVSDAAGVLKATILSRALV